MRRYFTLYMAALLLSASSCKKEKPENRPTSEPPAEKKWVVSTVAGDGASGYLDGPALSARFFQPHDVAVAVDGTIYVTDLGNRRIRKISGGQVSTFAGSGIRGIVNDNGILAQFDAPFLIAADRNGSLYVSDEQDAGIRKISPSAGVSTYAGGLYGFADGAVDVAMFNGDVDVAADLIGNIYLADPFNHRIRKINTSGQVSTIAGSGIPGFKNGTGVAAQFNRPGGIAIDKDGNLYIADNSNFRVRKITVSADVSTFAGNGTQGDADGNADVAQFSNAMDNLVVDTGGNVYIADNNRIRKITPEGVVSTIAGSTAGYEDGIGISAKFDRPAGLGIDAQGNIYVADPNNNRVRKLSFQ